MLDDRIRKISSVEGESAGGMRYFKINFGLAAVNGDEERRGNFNFS